MDAIEKFSKDYTGNLQIRRLIALSKHSKQDKAYAKLALQRAIQIVVDTNNIGYTLFLLLTSPQNGK